MVSKKAQAERGLSRYFSSKVSANLGFCCLLLGMGLAPRAGDRHCSAVPAWAELGLSWNQAAPGTHSSSFRPHLA